MREHNTIKPTHELFLETASQYKDKIAVIDQDRSYTYGDLAELSARPLPKLLKLSGANHKVALLIMDSDAWGIISILSALRAGYVYAFMEPTQSVDFIRASIQQLRPSLIITTIAHTQFSAQFAADDLTILDIRSFEPVTEPVVEAEWDMDEPAMIYFTSGSTGTPKGLKLTHRINTHRTLWNTLMPNLSDKDVVALSMSFQFVRSPEAIWMTLTRGATAAIYRFQEHSIAELAAWIEKYSLTILQMPSSFADKFIHAIKDHPEYKLDSLRLISVGGERINLEAVRTYQQIAWLNFIFRFQIGSSETSSYYYTDYDRQTVLSESLWFESVTAGNKIFVKDEETGELLDRSATGELFVGSEKLFLGYVDAENALEQKMIRADDAPGGRLYATGDIGEIDSHGRMRVVGRMDKMVKIRGYRMDLDEIGLKTRALDRVRNAVCVVKTNKRGEKILVGYVEFVPNMNISIPALRSELLTKLEPYKIPTRLVILPQIPLTPTGKIDATHLPAVENQRPQLDNEYLAPSTDLQKDHVAIWEEVLDIEGIGITDNYFELGGDSISVLEMAQMVEERLGIKISANFIENATIAAILAEKDAKGDVGPINEQLVDQDTKAREERSRQFKAKFEKNLIIKLSASLITHFTYQQVNQFSRRLSGSRLLQWLLMVRGRRLYDRWLSEFEGADRGLFRKKVVYAELLRFANRSMRFKIDLDDMALADIERYSWHKYYYSMTHAFLDHEKGRSLPEFPVIGLEYALNALKSGEPVVFVAFHSNIYFSTRTVMEHQCAVEKIETITKNLGVHGKYSEDGGTGSMVDQTLSNAGVSIFAANLVNQGIPIIFYSDTIDPLTKNYSASILGRKYSIKGGFAEIAEAIDGTIIPTYGYITDDLKIGREFFPPLRSDKTDPTERIEDLVSQYALFMENVYKREPSTKNLNKIKNHYKNKRGA